MSWYWLILIVIALLLIVILFIYITKKKRRFKVSPYEEALISLIDGDENHAIKKFQESVFENSDNIEAYIRLAELLRKRNEPLKALHIHKYLLARRGIQKNIRNRILYNIAQDYITLKTYQKATDTLNQLLRYEPHNEKYYKILLHNYEESSLWNEAIQLFRRMAKLFNYSDDELINYEVFAAHQAYKNGNKDWAEKNLTRAVKKKPEHFGALLFLGDIKHSSGKIDEAIGLYEKAMSLYPENGYITYSRLMKAYYEKGEYEKIEDNFKKVLRTIPDDETTIASLADYYLKMGRSSEAYELLTTAKETHPDSFHINLILLSTEIELNKEDASSTISHIIDIYAGAKQYKCKNCGMELKEFSIRCPECKKWQTITEDILL
jgi:lipopolysaccharide biosynthesis regulator YciM